MDGFTLLVALLVFPFAFMVIAAVIVFVLGDILDGVLYLQYYYFWPIAIATYSWLFYFEPARGEFVLTTLRNFFNTIIGWIN